MFQCPTSLSDTGYTMSRFMMMMYDLLVGYLAELLIGGEILKLAPFVAVGASK